MLGGMK